MGNSKRASLKLTLLGYWALKAKLLFPTPGSSSQKSSALYCVADVAQTGALLPFDGAILTDDEQPSVFHPFKGSESSIAVIRESISRREWSTQFEIGSVVLLEANVGSLHPVESRDRMRRNR